MEITKEFLRGQITGLLQELENLIEQASQLRGAIGTCEMLIKHLEAPEPEEKEEDNTSSSEEQDD